MHNSEKIEKLAKLNVLGWNYLKPKLLDAGFVPSAHGFARSINAGALTGMVHVYVHQANDLSDACLINQDGLLGFMLFVNCAEVETVVAQFLAPVDDFSAITFVTGTRLLMKNDKTLKIRLSFSDEEFYCSLDHFFQGFMDQGLRMLAKIMQPASLLKQIQYKQTKIYTTGSMAAKEFGLLIHLEEYEKVLDQMLLLEKNSTWGVNNSLTAEHVPVIRQLIADRRGIAT